MKDLDFDELDRAVNSLITNSPGSNNVIEPKPEEPQILDDNNQSQPQAVDSTEDIVAESIAVSNPTVRPSNSGRFMDVVHPSSDMRTVIAPAAPENTRQGITVSPIDDSTSNVEKEKVDIQSEQKAPVPIMAEQNEDSDIDKINDDITETLNQTPSESPDSPFLTDAKVEKRPLGAFSGDFAAALSNELAPTKPKEIAVPKEDVTKEDAKPAEIDTPFPAELQKELLLIESDSTTHPELIEQAIPSVDRPKSFMTQPNTTSPDPIIPKTTKSLPIEPVSVAPTVINVTDNSSIAKNSIPFQTPSMHPQDVIDVKPVVPNISNDNIKPIAVDNKFNADVPVIKPANNMSDLNLASVPDVKATTSSISSSAPAAPSIGVASITQQYTEKPNTGDQNSGPIYDTDIYHKFFLRPMKSKPTWFVIIWIVLLLVIGAIAGALMYSLI